MAVNSLAPLTIRQFSAVTTAPLAIAPLLARQLRPAGCPMEIIPPVVPRTNDIAAGISQAALWVVQSKIGV